MPPRNCFNIDIASLIDGVPAGVCCVVVVYTGRLVVIVGVDGCRYPGLWNNVAPCSDPARPKRRLPRPPPPSRCWNCWNGTGDGASCTYGTDGYNESIVGVSPWRSSVSPYCCSHCFVCDGVLCSCMKLRGRLPVAIVNLWIVGCKKRMFAYVSAWSGWISVISDECLNVLIQLTTCWHADSCSELVIQIWRLAVDGSCWRSVSFLLLSSLVDVRNCIVQNFIHQLYYRYFVYFYNSFNTPEYVKKLS